MMRQFSMYVLIAVAAFLPVSAHANAGPWQGNDVMEARLITAATAAGDSRIIEAGLEFRLEPGWKVYWRSPGDAGLPPVLNFSSSAEIENHHMEFPAPKRFSILGFDSFGYDTEVILPLRLERKNPGRQMTILAQLEGLVCKDICIPVAETLTLTVPRGEAMPSAEARRIAQAKARVPRSGTAAGQKIAEIAIAGDRLELSLGQGDRPIPLSRGDVLVEAEGGFSFSKPVFRGGIATLEVSGRKVQELIGNEVTVTVITPAALIEERHVLAAGQVTPINLWQGVGLMLLIAFAGGVILNLMPCVLPVLSLKLATVLGHGGEAQRGVRISFLITASGVIFSFLMLGALLLMLRYAGVAIGWGVQFQQPAFLLISAAGIGFFGLVMLDVINLPVPSSFQNIAARMPRRGLVGDFASGALATLLATPCSAPFVGTAIAFALVAPALPLLAIFLSMGVGLALPWLMVALRPGMLASLPRPGPWLIWLKRVLALGLFATSVWLLSIMAGIGGADSKAAQGWVQWQPEAEAAYIDAGRVVLVDVSAEWCITCKANKVLVLETEAMQRDLDDAGVVRLQADWTRPDEAISRYLASFGRYGIPFNVVYGPAAPAGIILPELLSRDAVLDAVRRAMGEAT